MNDPKLQPAVQRDEGQLHKVRAEEQRKNPPSTPSRPTVESLTRPEGHYATHPQDKPYGGQNG